MWRLVLDRPPRLAEGEKGQRLRITVLHHPPPTECGDCSSERLMWLLTVPSGRLSTLEICACVRS